MPPRSKGRTPAIRDIACRGATEFAKFSLAPNSSAKLSALPSAVYTIALPSIQECRAQGAAQHACGFSFVEAYTGPPDSSCSTAAQHCCFLNPYLGCAKSSATGIFTRFGAATLGIMHHFDVVYFDAKVLCPVSPWTCAESHVSLAILYASNLSRLEGRRTIIGTG